MSAEAVMMYDEKCETVEVANASVDELAKEIKGRVQNKQSYSGEEIKNLINQYMEAAGENAAEVIKNFYKSYVLGEGCFPMGNKIYYFLINKAGTMAPMRDVEKSPKREYVKPLEIV